MTELTMRVDRRTLREQCLTMLRSAITAGKLAPGTRLVETELSAAFGVSRGTLREALRALQQEGLVTAGESGLSVRVVGRQEIVDIFAVRAAIEGLAVAILCSRAERSEVVDELRRALERMAQTAGDLAAQAEADLEFHQLLCRLTGNETLVRSWEFLSGHVRVTVMHAGPERALHNMNVNRHSPIVDAIEAGDEQVARRIITEHMDEAATRLASSFPAEEGKATRPA
jgi:DNA-binding GntR family transcriptional regulator